MPPRPTSRPPGRHFDQPPLVANGLATRRVRVFVPGGQPRQPRPLLVMFDGQNAFDDAGSHAGGWRAHVVAQRMPQQPDRAPVIVAIDHGGQARIDELAPWRDKGRGGQFAPLLQALVAMLTPQLRAQLQVSPLATRTIIAGSSLGGLAALYAHVLHPGVFGRCLAMSPSLWFAHGQFFNWLNETAQLHDPSRIYMDAGLHESAHMVHNVRHLAAALTHRGYHPATLRLLVDPRGHHRETSWRRRLPGALRFLLQAERMSRAGQGPRAT